MSLLSLLLHGCGSHDSGKDVNKDTSSCPCDSDSGDTSTRTDSADSGETGGDSAGTGDDTGDSGPLDTASALEPPATPFGDQGFRYSGVTIWGLHGYARLCGLTATGRVFCWGDSGVCTQPSRRLRATGLSFQDQSDATLCAIETATGDVLCWDTGFENDRAGARYPGPFASVKGVCGVLYSGELSCWQQVSGAYAGELPDGRFVSVDARAGGVAVSEDGDLVTWGWCIEGDEDGCYRWHDTEWSTGPFRASSIDYSNADACAVDSLGVSCSNLSGSGEFALEGGFIDLDTSYVSSQRSGCALGSDGTAVCWGSATTTSSDQLVEIEGGFMGGVIGIDTDGHLQAVTPAKDWSACTSR